MHPHIDNFYIRRPSRGVVPTLVTFVSMTQKRSSHEISKMQRFVARNIRRRQILNAKYWRVRCVYGNLFSAWTVKRVDEIDQASSSAMAELLTYLDYLRKGNAIIATTNEFAKLRSQCKGRLESRFVRFHVEPPSVQQTMAFLCHNYRIDKRQAHAIALGAVPEGCLPTVGCNLRTAINDAEGLKAAKKARAA
jgi:MoxR-like ATPase